MSSILPTRSAPLFDKFLEALQKITPLPPSQFYRFYLFLVGRGHSRTNLKRGRRSPHQISSPHYIFYFFLVSSPSQVYSITVWSLYGISQFPPPKKAVRMATYSRLRLLSAFRTPLLTRCYSTGSRLASDHVRIVEVGPRDGLQNEKKAIPMETKMELIRRLATTGVTTIEAGSFVPAKWVPQV